MNLDHEKLRTVDPNSQMNENNVSAENSQAVLIASRTVNSN